MRHLKKILSGAIAVIAITAIIFIQSCQSNNNGVIKYVNFPAEENLNLENILLQDSVFMRYPSKMVKTDSLIIFLDFAAGNGYFIQCYSCFNFDYVCSLLKKGQGPGEYITVNNIQCVNDTLYAYGRAEVYCIDVKKIKTPDYLIETVKFTGDFGGLVKGIKLGEYFYFPALSQLVTGRVLKFDSKGNYVSAFGEVRTEKKYDADEPVYQAWIPWTGGNKDILVMATHYGEVIDIYSLNDNSQITVKGKGKDPIFTVQSGIYAIPDGIMGFEDIKITQNYIYAIYNGETMKERRSERQGSQYIQIYDFQGNPVKRITLNEFVSAIYIDEQNSVLYALSVNYDQPLFRAKLP